MKRSSAFPDVFSPRCFRDGRAGHDGRAYLHTDALGSTDVVTDGTGAAGERRSYDASGKTHYVRIRGFNKNGHGVWTTSAGVLVL